MLARDDRLELNMNRVKACVVSIVKPLTAAEAAASRLEFLANIFQADVTEDKRDHNSFFDYSARTSLQQLL